MDHAGHHGLTQVLRCHSCGTEHATAFYSVDAVPTASNILLDDRHRAASYPTGPLELAVCSNCGFVFNHLFDSALIDYTAPYEESQAYSPTFSFFQDNLVDRLADTYNPDEVFEIGCGKGAFLEAMCRRAGAVGLGIDPAFQEGRVTGADLTVIKEFFDETRTALTGDLICCRHTLEHIQPVAEFVRLIRQSATERNRSVVLIEVPDTTRILVEGAFWDVFYEHCSYFTANSLSWLMAAQGLPLLRLAAEFDNQYLVVDAAVGSPDRAVDVAAVEATVERCSLFAEKVAAEVERWRHLIDLNPRTVVWGAGSKAVAFLAAIGDTEAIRGVVDINPYKQGSYLPGTAHAVIAPDGLTDLDVDLVVIMNPIYEGEITSMLADLGVEAEVASLGGHLVA